MGKGRKGKMRNGHWTGEKNAPQDFCNSFMRRLKKLDEKKGEREKY